MHDLNFCEAREQQHAFKNDAITRYAVAFVKAGLDLLDKGVGHFASDDVLESEVPTSGSGIAGSAVAMLSAAHIVTGFWATIPDEGILGGRRRSKRSGRHSAKIPCYSLTSRSVAETFLSRNGAATEPRQKELALC